MWKHEAGNFGLRLFSSRPMRMYELFAVTMQPVKRTHTHADTHARTHARTHAPTHARTHARTHTHAQQLTNYDVFYAVNIIILYIVAVTFETVSVKSECKDTHKKNIIGFLDTELRTMFQTKLRIILTALESQRPVSKNGNG